MDENIHGFEEKLESVLEKVKKLDSANKALILSFYENYCFKENLSLGRKEKVLSILRQVVLKLKKPLDLFVEKDLQFLKAELYKQNFSQHTVKSYLAVLKSFFRWLDKKKFSELLESKEWKIKNPYSLPRHQLSSDSLPSEGMCLKMLAVGSSVQSAYLALLAGAGLRNSEALLLKRENVHPQSDGSVVLNVVGKTGRREGIKVHAGFAYYILQHFNTSIFNIPTDFFITLKDGRHLEERNSLLWLQSMSVRAGFGKWVYYDDNENRGKKYVGRKVNPHIWRHFHANWCLENLNPIIAKKRLWGRVDTKMDAVYEHISREKEHQEYDIATGSTVTVQKTSLLAPKSCFKCKKQWPAGFEVCSDCGLFLDPSKEYEKFEKLKEERAKQGELVQEVSDLKQMVAALYKYIGKVEQK